MITEKKNIEEAFLICIFNLRLFGFCESRP